MSKNLGNLKAIQESLQKIFRFSQNLESSQQLYEDEVVFDAVLMNFIIIGESAARLTKKLKDETTDIPWKEIIAFRNIVAHNYFGVDPEEVFDIIKNHLPPFLKQLEELIDGLT